MRAPLVVLSDTEDSIIPRYQHRAIADAAASSGGVVKPLFLETDTGHNDLYEQAHAHKKEIGDFLERCRGAG